MLHTLLSIFLQIPSSSPSPGSNNKIEFNSTFDWIMFVILPIAIVILYFVWRKTNKK